MRFSKLMLQKFEAYKLQAFEYNRGNIDVAAFLIAHKEWNDAVEAFERECSSSSNFGAF